jgi:peptide/nickel transport system substrate-binding protein
MQGERSMRTKLGVVALAAALLLGACASDDDEGASGSSSGSTEEARGGEETGGQIIKAGWVNETDLEPATGGTLRVTLPAAPFGLDPTVASLGVTTGGAPLTAIFDTLLRWDPESGEYSGQLAESIEHSDDFSQWTLKLREGVNFTDGTPLDADAVEYSIRRMKGARGSAATYPDYVASYEKPDAQTVVFNMAQPLSNFDALLAGELGYVVSPSAVEADAEGFNTKPVGAGPFVVERFAADSELVLVRNDDYFGDDVPLDGIRFVWNPEQGASVDKLLAGETDMAMLTSIPEEVKAIEAGYPANTQFVAGSGLAINSDPARDFPGDDKRVRQAISLAIDRDAVNQRVNRGEGIMGDFLFPPSSRLGVETSFGGHDADEAKRLVEEVKAETGWDGSFELLTPLPDDYALAYQALLNSVGFKVTIDQVPSFLELVSRTNLGRNFDVSIHVMTTYETNVYQALNRSLSSTSSSNYLGYKNPAMDELLDELRAADADAMPEILERVGEMWQEEQPFVLTGAQPFTTVTGKDVGGLVSTVNGLILFHEAFKA